MQAIAHGDRPEPYFGVGFESLPQFMATFTPRQQAA